MAKNKRKETFKIPSHFASRRVENEIVVLNLKSSFYFSLNEVGARIWELLQQDKDEDSIVKELVKEYDAEDKTVRKHVKVFLQQLKSDKMIAVE